MNAEGIFLAEKFFGVAIVNSDGTQFPSPMWESSMSGKTWAAFPQFRTGLLQIKPQRWMYGQRWNDEVPPIIKRMPHEHPQQACIERSAGGIQTAKNAKYTIVLDI